MHFNNILYFARLEKLTPESFQNVQNGFENRPTHSELSNSRSAKKCSDFNLFIYYTYFSLFDDLHDLFAYEIFLQDQPKKFFFVKWGWLGAE
jgi:hypothetical protein